MSVDRTQPFETSRRFRADRTVEQLGALFGDAAWPNWHPRTARNVRRSVIHDRLAAAGAALRGLLGLGVPGVVRRPRRADPDVDARLGPRRRRSRSRRPSTAPSARPSACSTCR